ncbi:MAG: GNAT family N-acetyltransferase [Microgenomates group bacterium]
MIIPKAIQHYPDEEKFVYFSDDGKFVGTFAIIKDEIWSVKIFKKYRGNGYCVKMLMEFLQEFPGKYTLYVAKENIPARKSYEKIGFEYVQNLEIDFIQMFEMRIN